MIRRAGAALLVAAVSVLSGSTASAADALRVRPGAAFPVAASGFAPQAVVTVRLAGVPTGRPVTADRRGTVHTTWRAPRLTGRYRLLLSGLSPSTGRPSMPSGGAVIDVTVPRVVTLIFDVVGSPGSGGSGGSTGAPGHGSGSEGAHAPGSSPGPGSSHGHGHSGVSVTGTDVAGLVAAAIALVATGTIAVRLGRRRRRQPRSRGRTNPVR